MFSKDAFDALFRKCPEAVMVRAVLENALPANLADQVFEEHREEQYERTLLFSTVVRLLSLVVCGLRSSVHAAYQATEGVGVAVKSVYNKLNGSEPQIGEALVRACAERMIPVVLEMGPTQEPVLPGYQTRIVDGNHLAGTEHRIDELRVIGGAPLPGQALVVYDADLRLVRDVRLCEDAYTQERSIVVDLLWDVKPGEVWVADRNFCTAAVVFQIAANKGHFVIRRHASNVRFRLVGKERKIGATETGVVYEQEIVIENDFGEELPARLVRVALHQKTEDGDWEIEILTNLPAEISALQIAQAYRTRWRIEGAFGDMASILEAEIPALGHPRTALLAFCLGLIAYNVLQVVRAALAAAHGHEKVEAEVSSYYIASQTQYYWGALEIHLTAADWEERFGAMTPGQLAEALIFLAQKVRLSRLKKHPRGPKKPPPRRSHAIDEPHVSTARILAARKKQNR